MRTIVRALLVLVLLGVVGFVLLGYWTGASWPNAGAGGRPSGTIDSDTAKRRGAEIGEQAARATAKLQNTIGEAALTTKIKAKMALDDTIKAREIDASTTGSTVVLTGTVGSRAELDRAVTLTRETAGVTRVVDRLVVQVK
jgi:hypothetical protein